MSEKDLFDDTNLVDDNFDPDPLEPPASQAPEMTDADRIRRIVKAAQDRIANGRPTAGDYDVIKEYGGKAALLDHQAKNTKLFKK